MQGQDNDKTILGGVTLDLVYSIVSEQEKQYRLEGGEIVGRGKDCDIFIDDKKISRNHAELNIKNGRLQLKDLGSSNGTFLNGNKITDETNLANGDTVSFEKHIFTVKIEMSQNQQEVEAEPVEEDDSDYTAVVDMSEEYLAKLSAASKTSEPPKPPMVEKTKKEPVAKEPVAKEKSKPEKKVQSEKVQLKNKEENIPKSWVEETGSVDGTRMMDIGQLNALRAGANIVSKNDSDVTRLHCFIDGQEEIIELNISDYAQASGWEIGRDSSCDIVLDHTSVSNRHAQIIHQNGRWKIVNLVSTNGILINGQKKLTTYLSDGDKIGLGSVNLFFKATKSAQKSFKKSNSVQKTNKQFPVVPALLGVILIVLAVLIYLYMK